MGLIVFGIELEEEGEAGFGPELFCLFMCLALWPVGLGSWISLWIGKRR